MAAFRSSALDRLFQRHDRPAQADRARPWRHRHRGAGDARPAQRPRLLLQRNSFGERYHWYSSTGWIMWNSQVGGLLSGTTCCIFDGSPGGTKDKPDWTTLWRFVAQSKATFFGAGAAFFANCAKAEIDLADRRRSVAAALSRLDRLAAQRRHASLVQRALRRPVENQRQPGAGRHLVGEHFRRHRFRRRLHRGQPFFFFFFFFIANCRRRRARCSAACSVLRSKPSANRAAP